ncbi:hypothetical protein MY11210_008942 [Beauveria gryllotalpidicola]
MRLYWAAAAAVLPESLGLPASPAKIDTVMKFRNTPAGRKIESGVELRILPVGDSITVGFGSEIGGDGDGYRRRLRDDLSGNKVVFAGTEMAGTMDDGYFVSRHSCSVSGAGNWRLMTNGSAQKAAWNGKTIQFIANHIDPSLNQRPNVVLVAAGTNDMNPNHAVSTEGNDPAQAADRLGKLVDRIVGKCPDATVLVAMIIDTCDQSQEPQTQRFQKLIPGVVQKRRDAGHHVLAVDFTTFVPKHGNEILRDCIHPTNRGYRIMGDYWYDFMTQIPSGWIQAPVGMDPSRPAPSDPSLNRGIDKNVPPPDIGQSPIHSRPDGSYRDVRDWAVGSGPAKCDANPTWKATGKIAAGLGRNGDWKFQKKWEKAGEVAAGFGLNNTQVRLHDMNGDGRAGKW